MPLANLLLCGLFLGGSLLMIAISVPMIQGRVPRNALYGFRTPKTLRSDAVWYPANRFSGRALFQAGVAQALLVLPLFVLAFFVSTDTIAWLGLIAMVGPLLLALYASFRYLARL